MGDKKKKGVEQVSFAKYIKRHSFFHGEADHFYISQNNRLTGEPKVIFLLVMRKDTKW